MVADGDKRDDPLPFDHLSKRDREALHRLLKNFSETELNDLIAQERSRLDLTAKPDRGAPRSPKAQQPLLVALYVARSCHAPISVRGAAHEIYDVVEIRIIRPRKHGLPTVRSIKSAKALEEDLRVGLKTIDVHALALTMVILVYWRLNHVNPKWGGPGLGSVKQTVSFFPKKPTRPLHWIDALMTKFPAFISSPLSPRN
jgi:hypothetical protein